MALSAGERLGPPYEIRELLGAGGMDSPRLCQEESSCFLGDRRAGS